MIDVILVNTDDEPQGTMEKLEAHHQAQLHRAFSVLIFNQRGQLMLQQRAAGKYHSPLLWTNTCCSHPYPQESTLEAAHRRLQEEMGFNTPLQHQYSFIYRAELDQGLVEHELDHVFTGVYQGPVNPNPNEVQSWRWMSPQTLDQQMAQHPKQFTEWFKIIWPHWQAQKSQVL